MVAPLPVHPHPSPNWDNREGIVPELLVLHYTGMPTQAEALDRMCDPTSSVSAHYLVSQRGRIYQLVEEKHRAWHAGVSAWRGHRNINHRSIGIELTNPGHEHGYQRFPRAQIDALISLLQAILKRWPIPARNIVGHADIAPDRKEDPGEYFPWERLAKAGIGLWPKEDAAPNTPKTILFTPGMQGENVAQLQQRLHTYGYALPVDGIYGARTQDVVRAFARHFAPHRLDGAWDSVMEARLASLLQQVK